MQHLLSLATVEFYHIIIIMSSAIFNYFLDLNKNFPKDPIFREVFVANQLPYLAVLTLTPGPIVETTVQDLIY